MIDKIINYIRLNKVSTTEVADCLGKSGALSGISAVNRGLFCVGKVKWVYAYDQSNWPVHEQIRDMQAGSVVFIEAFDCGDRSVIGELVSKYILLYRQGIAIVTNANMRDAHKLIKENYPIWCHGFSPIGCFNNQPSYEFDASIVSDRMRNIDGSIMVCDDSGVVVIPKECHTQEFLNKLIAIEDQEDTWFDCIDRRKWDTFDTVCLKKYKDE